MQETPLFENIQIQFTVLKSLILHLQIDFMQCIRDIACRQLKKIQKPKLHHLKLFSTVGCKAVKIMKLTNFVNKNTLNYTAHLFLFRFRIGFLSYVISG